MNLSDLLWRRSIGRRALLAAVPGLALLAMGASCGGDEDEDTPTATPSAAAPISPTATTAGEPVPTATDAAGAEWSFTDDRDRTITLPKRPERVFAEVSAAASLWDFGVRPLGVFGRLHQEDGALVNNAGSLNPEAFEFVSEGWDALDLEQFVVMQPDLIVSTFYGAVAPELWAINPDAEPALEQIAPTVGINLVDQPVTGPLTRFAELSEALGADLQAPEVVAAQAAFDAASSDVTAAVEENPGVSVLCVAGDIDVLYVANPAVAADLMYFDELGVELIMPDNADELYWEALSWEQALKYPADLILNDARSEEFNEAWLRDQLTFAEHPAMQADQVGNWYTEYVISYQGLTAILEELAADIRAARADVVQARLSALSSFAPPTPPAGVPSRS